MEVETKAKPAKRRHTQFNLGLVMLKSRLRRAERDARAMGFKLAAHLVGVALLEIEETEEKLDL